MANIRTFMYTFKYLCSLAAAAAVIKYIRKDESLKQTVGRRGAAGATTGGRTRLGTK